MSTCYTKGIIPPQSFLPEVSSIAFMSDEMLRNLFRDIYSLGGLNCAQTLDFWLNVYLPPRNGRIFAFKGIFDFSAVNYELEPGSTFTGTREIRWMQYSIIGGVVDQRFGSTFIDYVGGVAVNRVDDFSQFMGGPLVIVQDDVAVFYEVVVWNVEKITLPMLSVAATIDDTMDFQCVLADAVPECDFSPKVDVEIYQFRDGVSECANFARFVNLFGIPKGNTK